ncbi:hypothetical protein SDC9_199584 [bioreactor metagenome]|uniref:Uncharacterized protein n=1 Tax=bioreactor metagenome TaxID=1076179 RepID=A0A645IXK5_9ZZZZ
MRLLEDFLQTLTAVQLTQGGLIQIGAHLGESSQVTIGGHIQTQAACHLFHGFYLSGTTHARNGDTHVDGWAYTGIEEIVFQVDLTIRNGNNVGRNVGRDIAEQSFDDRQCSERTTCSGNFDGFQGICIGTGFTAFFCVVKGHWARENISSSSLASFHSFTLVVFVDQSE